MVSWTLLFFASALSLDALSAGFAYGVRRIKIPFISQLVFFLASTVTVSIAIICGHGLSRLIPPLWGGRIGGLILLGIGLWWLLRRKGDGEVGGEEEANTLVRIQVASLAVVIQVLEEPACADMDASGVISAQESLILGLALSLDALGASFGAALAGANGFLLVLLIGFFQQLFLLLGILLGRSTWLGWLRKKGTVMASVVLCLLGLFRLLRAG